MNQKNCKKLRREIRHIFPDLPVRALVYQKLGTKKVRGYKLDEKGIRVPHSADIETGRMINAPQTQRRIYLDTKRKYS